MPDSPQTTEGQRVYLVRLALGDGVRNPMPMRDFAALLTERRGRKVSPSTVSDLETGKRRLSLDDVALIAAVDPLKRGRLWLGWDAAVVGELGQNGDKVTLPPGAPDPFRATGEVVPHSAYVEATTPTGAEREQQEREAARRRRPGATGRRRRA